MSLSPHHRIDNTILRAGLVGHQARIFRILSYTRNSIFSAEQLHEVLHGDDWNGGPIIEVIQVHLVCIRRKLRKAQSIWHIHTIPGRGFILLKGDEPYGLFSTSSGVTRQSHLAR